MIKFIFWQVLPLRNLEHEHKIYPTQPSLSDRIKLVATHFGRAIALANDHARVCDAVFEVRTGIDGSCRECEGKTRCWDKLASGFRSLARSLAALGWGRDFLASVGSAVELSLSSLYGTRYLCAYIVLRKDHARGEKQKRRLCKLTDSTSKPRTLQVG